MQTRPGQIAVEILTVFGRFEVSISDTPIGDRPHDAVDQLTNAGFTLRRSRLTVEVLADDDIRRQGGPCLGNLAVRLLEKDFTRFVFDLSGS